MKKTNYVVFGVLALTLLALQSPKLAFADEEVVLSTVFTVGSRNITSTTATLEGSLTSAGGDPVGAIIGFEYGETTAYGTTISPADFSGHEATGLTCNTTYHFRAIATNSAGTANGDDMTFTTLTCPVVEIPVVYTDIATSTGETYAVLAGNILSGAEIYNIGFQIGATAAYDYSISPGTPAGYYNLGLYTMGTAGILKCNTTYHYRFFAVNNFGTGFGDDRTFTTNECAGGTPLVITDSAKEITTHGATLVGHFMNATSGVTYTSGFEFGTTTDYGNTTTYPIAHLSGAPFAAITGYSLYCGTTYHFRAWASDGDETWNGEDRTFETAPCPVLVTTAATNISTTSAVIGAQLVSTDGGVNQYGFEYGTTTAYGMTTPIGYLADLSGPQSFESALSELTCGTTYHYKPQISFSEISSPYETNLSTIFGEDMTFTTSPCASSGGSGGAAPRHICDIDGDLNKDCRVDMLDYVLLMSMWGKIEAGNAADLNQDDKVDALDLVVLMFNWSK